MTTDPFENIDLDFDTPTAKKDVIEDELNLDEETTPEVKDNIDLSDKVQVTPTASIIDEVEEDILKDPSTKDNKQKELQNVEVSTAGPLDDLDIEMEQTPETKAPEAEAPKKRGRKAKEKTETPKAEKPKEKTPEENIADLENILGDEDDKPVVVTPQTPPSENENILDDITDEVPLPTNDNRKIYLDPELNIEFLEKEMYQTRSVSRSPEEIAELATLIRRQGQLEPIHVVIKNGIKYLVAGFGRVAALTLLKEKIAKAIVYENITEDEILKISSGTNTGRLELREWDKIASVGLYSIKNPTVDIKQFPAIFGFEKSAIYDYISIYNFFKNYKVFVEYFNKVPLPQFMFKSLMKNLREFPQMDSKKVIDFVEAMLNYEKTSATKFSYELAELLAKEKSKMEELEKEKKFDKLEIENDGISDQTGKDAVNQSLKKAVENHKNETNAKADFAAALCISIVKSLESIIADVAKVHKIEDFKKAIPSTSLSMVSKKMSEVQGKIVELM